MKTADIWLVLITLLAIAWFVFGYRVRIAWRLFWIYRARNLPVGESLRRAWETSNRA